MKTLQLRVSGNKGCLKKQGPHERLSEAAEANVPPKPLPVVEPMATQEMARPKKPRPAKTPAVEAEPTLIIDIFDAPKALLPRERLLFPRARVMDSQYIVLDVPTAQIEAVLNLPPRFSLVFQALYESFFEQDSESATQSSLVDHTRQQISL